jgi:hypothetical protein
MKTTLRALPALAVLALAHPAAAQQAAPSHPRLGLGVSLNTTTLGLTSPANTTAFVRPKFYVPFYVAPNIRLEPEIGWLSATDDNTSTTNSAFDLGIGALFTKPVSPVVDLYAGARLAAIWTQTEQDVGGGVIQRVKQRNISFAPVLGGEYTPSPWFSVGVEAQLEFIFLGDEDVNTGGVSTTGRGGNAKGLEGLVFLRVYFL